MTTSNLRTWLVQRASSVMMFRSSHCCTVVLVLEYQVCMFVQKSYLVSDLSRDHSGLGEPRIGQSRQGIFLSSGFRVKLEGKFVYLPSSPLLLTLASIIPLYCFIAVVRLSLGLAQVGFGLCIYMCETNGRA